MNPSMLILPPNKQLQPTAFGAGMRGALCQLSFWLLERVLPESAAVQQLAAANPAGVRKG